MNKDERDMTRLVLDWEEQGVPLSEIEVENSGVWIATKVDYYPGIVHAASLGFKYRRKPAPKLIPWTAEDVPFPCAIRRKWWPKGMARGVLHRSETGVLTMDGGGIVETILYKELADPDNEWEQLDGKPCAKEG